MGGVTDDIVVLDALIGSNILDNEDLPTPVRAGHTLEGWAYDDAGTQVVGADDNITPDLIIYAIWEEV